MNVIVEVECSMWLGTRDVRTVYYCEDCGAKMVGGFVQTVLHPVEKKEPCQYEGKSFWKPSTKLVEEVK
jgi:hypothetical protein